MSSDELRESIYGQFSQKATEELLDIWQANDHTEWSETTFDVIREILQERQVELPVQDEVVLEGSVPPREAAAMSFAQILFSFEGRIGRQTYWLGALLLIVFAAIGGVLEGAAGSDGPALGIIWRLLLLWPNLALTVKRWHDRDKSGWWILIGLIPFIGQLWAFIENGFLKGTEGPNRFGSRAF
jgi:uncharacterized membrane protein YhaH (DUF805 family)